MDTQQQIAALKAALAALDAAIAQTEATLRLATAQADITGLTSALVDLRSERTRTQFELDSLEAAAVVVTPLSARARAAGPRTGRGLRVATRRGRSATEVKALRKEIVRVSAGREVVGATLALAKNVTKLAKTLRMSGDDPTTPKRRKKPKPRNP